MNHTDSRLLALESAVVLAQKTILVVDDKPEILALMEDLLTQERPYQVICATTVQAAVEMAADILPQLLLLDYRLPDGNGIVLYDLLHARIGWQDIPAIVVSADVPQCEVHARSLSSIAKPFDLDAFLELVDTALGIQSTMPAFAFAH